MIENNDDLKKIMTNQKVEMKDNSNETKIDTIMDPVLQSLSNKEEVEKLNDILNFSEEDAKKTDEYLSKFEEPVKTEKTKEVIKEEISNKDITLENITSKVETKNPLVDEENKYKPIPEKNSAGQINLKGKIDLSAINIVKDFSEVDITRNANKLLRIDSTFQFLMLQSGYSGEMSALNNHELRSMATSFADYYSMKNKAYHLFFKHIESTSIGQITYEDFLKITSYLEQDTLYYAAFASTFRGTNEFTVQCTNPDCSCYKKGFSAKIHNNNLIRILGEELEAYNQRDRIIEKPMNTIDLVKNSLVHTTHRAILPDSNIIVDIRIPSLDEYLNEALYSKNPKYLDEFNSEIGAAFFLDCMLIPDFSFYSGDPATIKWIPIKDKEKKVYYLSNLQISDFQYLIEEIDKFSGKYKVDYAIQNTICPECGTNLGDVTLDMEAVLFTLTTNPPQYRTE